VYLLCGRVPDLQSWGCGFESQPGLLRTKVYSAFHPSGVGKWVPAAAGKAKAGMAHSECGWTCGCAGKTVKSLENTCHTWALLRWWFTTKRRYIKCVHLYLYLYPCVMVSSVAHVPPFHRILWNQLSAFRLRNKQTNKTNTNKNITSLAEVIFCNHLYLYLPGSFSDRTTLLFYMMFTDYVGIICQLVQLQFLVSRLHVAS